MKEYSFHAGEIVHLKHKIGEHSFGKILDTEHYMNHTGNVFYLVEVGCLRYCIEARFLMPVLGERYLCWVNELEYVSSQEVFDEGLYTSVVNQVEAKYARQMREAIYDLLSNAHDDSQYEEIEAIVSKIELEERKLGL